MAQRLNGQQQGGIAFKARRFNALNSGANAAVNLVFDQENYDYGNCYDTSTGYFTAPIDGIYSFRANAFTETTTATGRAFMSSRGTAVTGTNPNGTARDEERARDGTVPGPGGIYRIEGNWEQFMRAGETFGVILWTSSVNQLGHRDTWFAGHLVMAV